MKRLCLIYLLIALLLPLVAKHSDEFLLGTYSYILNPFPFFKENRETLANHMQQMGYNSNIIETNQNDQELGTLLDILDQHGLDAWIIDRGFSNDPSSSLHYSITPLATSSYQRFEAEFQDERDVKPGDGKDSRFWYASRNYPGLPRVGSAVKNKDASNGYVWSVKSAEHKAGFAMGDITYRWPNFNGYNIRTGHDFHFFSKDPTEYKNESIWITYRFKISNVSPDTKPEDALLTFQPAGYPLSPTGFAAKAVEIQAISPKGSSIDTQYRYWDLMTKKEDDDFVEFTLQIPYKELDNAGLLEKPGSSLLALANLNPRLYWHGNCDLELDYVEMRDQISHDLMDIDNDLRNGILSRAREIISKGNGNVSGFYAFDEPFQGQFDSYRKLQGILAEEDIDIITACYDYRSSYIIMDSKKNIGYDHLDSFLKQVKPNIFCPDIYPLLPQYAFNPDSGEKEFIQDVLDKKLLKAYEQGIRYKQEDRSRTFYPIVQAFGRWTDAEPDSWGTWILPPYATQKALLYLPLVYGADGVFHYRLQAFQSPDGYGDYVGLATHLSNNKYVKPYVGSITMDAIMHTNPKVKTYGEKIRNLSWMGANSVHPKALEEDIPSAIPIKSLKTDMQMDSPYSGFIQVGYYLDSAEKPWLMVVNRRGNYFSPGKVTDEIHVHPNDYDTYFPQASPQSLHIELKKEAIERFGKYPGLLDPHTQQIHVADKQMIKIDFPAGEAGLYQMVNSLPKILNDKLKIQGETFVSGIVNLGKNANLKLDKNAKLTLLPGSKLLVSPLASITLAGEIELLGDAELQIYGYLKADKHKLSLSEESTYINEGKAPRPFFKRLFGIH
jgi:hypothetical protein